MARFRPPEGSAGRARRLRKNPTDAERALWRLLRQGFGEWHFRRQVPIRRFFADFASHRAKLVIEVDGGQHGGPADATRAQVLESEGCQVIRFWNHDVLANPHGCGAAIAGALPDRSPPPRPSPIEGAKRRHGDNRTPKEL